MFSSWRQRTKKTDKVTPAYLVNTEKTTEQCSVMMGDGVGDTSLGAVGGKTYLWR